MDWSNVNLNDGFERSQNILDGYSFDTLLFEISTNLVTMDEANISRYFENQMREKIDIARSIFKSNLKNIVADALEHQNLDSNPNKPTNEEWKAVMASLSSNIGQPQGIKAEHGEYFFDHFLECLPPIIFSNTYTLCSEPYSTNSIGETTYIGIYKKKDDYFGVITSKRLFVDLLRA